jgi:IS605 OrfB family transposase
VSILTYKFRIKDSTSKKKLEAMAWSVNQVWNYCNEVSILAIKNKRQFLTGFDLNKLTTGVAKDLGLNSETVNAVCEEYVICRKQHKKTKLNWRSSKKSLGWIPFKQRSIHYLGEGQVKYLKHTFKFYESRVPINIKCGSFNQDARGNWYINFVCEVPDVEVQNTESSVGVDLGLKTTATYSDGTKFEGVRATRLYSEKLAIAQRANKKKQVTNIHRKIANVRKDSLHKETSSLVRKHNLIVVGDVSSKKLLKTNMAKSVSDNSWGAYKALLAYKTIRFGRTLKVVNEAWTSKTCHVCGVISADFGGLSGLSVREWSCKHCNTLHDRDVNAAKNILRLGQ